jgi:hypothetical protein
MAAAYKTRPSMSRAGARAGAMDDAGGAAGSSEVQKHKPTTANAPRMGLLLVVFQFSSRGFKIPCRIRGKIPPGTTSQSVSQSDRAI